MLPDPARYWHHVAHLDMADAQKTELINIVFRAMQSEVDRAFGHDPVQVVMATKRGKDALPAPDVIDLSMDDYHVTELSQTFNDKKGMKNE